MADLSDPLAGLEVGPRTSVVLVTRGHRHDYDCLRELARRGVRPRYIGMIGSRRRVRAAFEQLAAEGVPAEWLARVHAPLGLDIGAEMVLAARGGSARPLSERAQVLRRVRALAGTPRAEEP